MKVILLRDVPGTGKKWDVKEVSNGHGRNFLIPKGFAKEATPHAVAELTVRRENEAKEREVLGNLLRKNLEALAGREVILAADANEKGHLFRGIHAKEIVAQITKVARLEIPEDAITLVAPIKEIGLHTIPIAHGGYEGSILLRVEKK